MLVPMALEAAHEARLGREIERTGADTSVVVAADEQALATVGNNLLDPSRRGAAADEGVRQGGQSVDAVSNVWV